MIQTLYEYNLWANWRILDKAQRLSTNQLLIPVGDGCPSVRDLLTHIMMVQQMWLARFQEAEQPSAVDANEFISVEQIRTHWVAIDQATIQFVAAIDDQALAQLKHYVNDKGEPNVYPLWQMMVHQINHATQHRSEIAVALTAFGDSPGWMDFLIYIDETLSEQQSLE